MYIYAKLTYSYCNHHLWDIVSNDAISEQSGNIIDNSKYINDTVNIVDILKIAHKCMNSVY